MRARIVPLQILALACALAIADPARAGIPMRPSGPDWAIVVVAPPLDQAPGSHPSRLVNTLEEGYGYRRENIVLLAGGEAHVEAIREAIASIASRKETPRSVLVVLDALVTSSGAEAIRVAGSNPAEPWTLLQPYEVMKLLDRLSTANLFVVMPSCERIRGGLSGSVYAGRTLLQYCPTRLETQGVQVSVASLLAEVLGGKVGDGRPVTSGEVATAMRERLPFPVDIQSVRGADELRFTPAASRVTPFVLTLLDPSAALEARLRAIDAIARGIGEEKGRRTPDSNAISVLVGIASGSSELPALRTRSIAALGEIGFAPSFDALAALFSRAPEPEIRRSIVQAASRFDSPAASTLLTAALGDADASVRVAALGAVTRSGGPEARRIATAALNDPSPDVVVAALQVLAAHPDPASDDRFRLLPLLSHPSPAVRAELVATWVSLGGTVADRAFLEAFVSDADPGVRAAIGYALGRAPLPDQMADEIVQRLLASVRRNTPTPVRKAAIWTLGERRVARAYGPLREIAQQEAEGLDVRVEAIEALGKLKDWRATRLLTDILQKEAAPELRRAAATALGSLGNPAAAGVLAAAAEDPVTRREAGEALKAISPGAGELSLLLASEDPAVRSAAVTKLVIEHPDESSRALPLLGDPVEAVRESTVSALNAMGPEPALEAQVRQLVSEGTPRQRVGAAELIARWGGDRDVELLVAQQGDPDPEIRAAVIRAVGQLNTPKVGEVAAKGLRDDHPAVRMSALAVIASQNADFPGLSEELLRLAKDPAPEVRQAAIDLLRERGLK